MTKIIILLNKQPIFINAFARGGSNILMNLLLTHPDVCISSGETHKVFKGTKWDHSWRKIKKRLLYDYPIRILTGQDLFGVELLADRKPVPEFVKKYIDRILYEGRFIANLSTHNQYKYPGIEYTYNELEKCRLLTKSLNGTVFTVDLFSEIYSDATFFGLVRNGLAVCEGHLRRGYTAEYAGNLYARVSQKMFDKSRLLENYHLVTYEEMVEDPHQFMLQLFKIARLNPDIVQKVRLQSKKIMNSKGERSRIAGKNREVIWYSPDELKNQIKSDVNKNQIKQLSVKDKKIFLSIAGDVMDELGYSCD